MRKAERWEMPEAIRRRVKISEARFYRWKHWDGTMKLVEVEELKAPRDENALLKRLAADQALNIQVPKEVTQKWVRTSQRSHAVGSVFAAGLGSARYAFRYLWLARSSLAFRRTPLAERRVQTEAVILELSRKHPLYG